MTFDTVSDIDTLLAGARLVPTAPYRPGDIEAAEARIAARVATRPAGGTEARTSGPVAPTDGAGSPACGDGASACEGGAPSGSCRVRTGVEQPALRRPPVHPSARDLRALCEALLKRTGALRGLGAFLGSALPEPSGARVLGGLLHLAGCEDSARFWWQYGAGAGDTVSSYCLYLHHRSLGEDEEADWWLSHTDITPATLGREATEVELATALHVLRGLRRGRRGLPKALRALVEYVPAVVGFVDDDLELPLPDGDLAGLVEEVVTHGTPPAGERRRARSRPLPERRESPVHTVSSATPRTARHWSRDVQEALRKCEETVAC
ncbi:hypothetical protein [Streptomyces sp. NBC_00582]|uniref:hypothetical protein n=1 Tax=Streptomyces sp. NBC_00582 TaxID=2975783 RepID=UPI002E7FCF10|nr:hypothetical protein [Streptomyces sp. NBC_00582]WUB66809.1 hypothetical protein OG852_43600 [Streptomyces sp. NBC_00582]